MNKFSDFSLLASGAQLIKKYEGFQKEPYICPGGFLTIGYGHRIPDENYLKQFNGIALTEEGAETLLRGDMIIASVCLELHLSAMAKEKINQNQINALISFIYNIGCLQFSKSTILKLINDGDFTLAAQQFDRWIHAGAKALPGLVKRRAAEKELFLKEI